MGSLYSCFKRGVHLSFQTKCTIAQDVLLSLQAMHQAGFVHRDLHIGNILLYRDKTGAIHGGLIDFGRSCLAKQRCRTKPQGSPHINPPETMVRAFKRIDTVLADRFAAGCFLYRLFREECYDGALLYDCRDVPSLSWRERVRLYHKASAYYTHMVDRLRYHPMNGARGQVQRAIVGLLNPVTAKRLSLEEVLQDLE